MLSDWWAMPGDSNDSRRTPAPSSKTRIVAIDAGLDVELPLGLQLWTAREPVQHREGHEGPDRHVRQSNPVREVPLQRRQLSSAPRTRATDDRATPSTTAGSSAATDRTWRWPSRRRWRAWFCSRTTGSFPSARCAKSIAVVGATVPYVINNGSSSVPASVNFATDVRGGDFGSSRVFPDPTKQVGPFDGICMAAGGTPVHPNATTDTCNGAPVTVATNNKTDLTPVMTAAVERRLRRRDGRSHAAGRGRGLHEGQRSQLRRDVAISDPTVARRQTDGCATLAFRTN